MHHTSTRVAETFASLVGSDGISGPMRYTARYKMSAPKYKPTNQISAFSVLTLTTPQTCHKHTIFMHNLWPSGKTNNENSIFELWSWELWVFMVTWISLYTLNKTFLTLLTCKVHHSSKHFVPIANCLFSHRGLHLWEVYASHWTVNMILSLT